MKKRICLLLTLIISIFVGVKSVGATYAWIECDYEAYGTVPEGRPLVLVGGYTWDNVNKQTKQHYYRLIYDMSKIDRDVMPDNRNNMRPFTGEWYKTSKGAIDHDESEKYSQEEALKMISEGICPSVINSGGSSYSVVFGGISDSKPIKTVELEPQYVMYEFFEGVQSYVGFFVVNEYGEWLIYKDNKLIRNPFSNGAYGSLHFNFVGDIYWVGSYHLKKYDSNFFEVSEHHDFELGPSEKLEVIMDNGKKKDVLTNYIEEWMKVNQVNIKYDDVYPVVSDSNNFNLNVESGRISKIDQNFASTFLNKFETMFVKLDAMERKQYPMCITTETTQNATTSIYNCIMNDFAEKYSFDFSDIPSEFSSIVLLDIKDYLNSKNVFAGFTDKELTELLKSVIYMDNNSDVLGLDAKRTSELRYAFEKYAKDKNVSVILDCDALISDDLRDKIDSYMNIFRIAIPIILIGFGIFDFTKAFFSGSEDEMKKAQTAFFKRILVTILIFLVPIFINLLLDLANIVWGNYYSNCDLF